MRGHDSGAEFFRDVKDLERAAREANASLERSKALAEWWPEAFIAGGPVTVRVERGVQASYHVVAENPAKLVKTEPLVYVPKAIWEYAADTAIARERAANGGGSPLEKLVRGLAEQQRAES